MAILNYTTTIPTEKTVSQIQALLAKKGALSISTEYSESEPTALYFSIQLNGIIINFRLPSNSCGVISALNRAPEVPRKLKYNNAHAKRVAWRIVKDWVEVQLALVESGQAEMAQVFMPYAITSTGETVFQRLTQSPQTLLGYNEQ